MFATRRGSATAARPQCAVPSASTALTTTSATATAARDRGHPEQHAGTHDRRRRHLVPERLALATLLTQLPPEVVQRPRARHVRHLVEVVRWRRGRRVPLERVRLPGVVAHALPVAPCLQHVDREEEDSEAHDVRADRRGEVVALPALVVVRVDPAGHSLEADEVQRHEREVEADEQEPELPLAEALVEESSEHLRPPVEEAGEDREDDAAEQGVVEVRDHEVAVVHLPVDREGREVDPGQAADDEEREEPEREQHRACRS